MNFDAKTGMADDERVGDIPLEKIYVPPEG